MAEQQLSTLISSKEAISSVQNLPIMLHIVHIWYWIIKKVVLEQGNKDGECVSFVNLDQMSDQLGTSPVSVLVQATASKQEVSL